MRLLAPVYRILVLTLAIAAWLVTGCTAPGEPQTPPDAAGPAIVASATLRPSATVRPMPKSGPANTPMLPSASATPEPSPVYTPDLAWLASSSRDGWQTYENVNYGYGFRYPPGWTLSEVTGTVDTMAGHRIDLAEAADSLNVLRIAFRGLHEDRQIVPTGISQGEIVQRGAILFLGETLTRQALVDRGVDSKILYELGEVVRGDLVFWIALDRVALGDMDRGLSAETQRTADAILSSVTASQP